MAQRGRFAWRGGFGAALLVLAVAVTGARPARATIRYGELQISGNLETQNLVRHPSIENWQFVQNRNTLLLRVDWDWLTDGQLINRYDLPFIKRSKLFLLYRGVYDGFYDLAPGGRQRGITRFDDLVGGPIEGNTIGTLRAGCDPLVENCLRAGLYSRTAATRSSVKRENRLRELYVDLALRDAPLSFRVGRQQVIWGETDQFRLMDIWNPLDLTWHLQQEPFEKIRVPLWLAKAQWDTGTVGPLTNTFVEVVYNPFDFQPGVKADFLPRPWAAPFASPVRAGQVQQVGPTAPILFSPVFDLQGTSVRKGDFERNPEDASEIGTRLHGVTPQGIEFTTNYLYGRSRGIGAQAGAPFALKVEEIVVPASLMPSTAIPGARFENQLVFPARVKARFVHPYVHIFGLTANYFEGNFISTVVRLETAYELGAPVQTVDPRKRVAVVDDRGSLAGRLSPIGFDKRDIWSGMLGFDRPTWIHWLNSKSTWFLTGQFFWSYINGNARNLRGINYTAAAPPYFVPEVGPPSLTDDGVGVWTSGSFAGQVERLQDATLPGNADNVKRWELLATLAATSVYRGGTIVPFLALAYDPANQNFLSQLQLEYFYTSNFIIALQQKYYTDFDRGLSLDPWGVGGLNNRRDESGIKLTFQF